MVLATAFENDCRHEGGELLALLAPSPVILVANAVEALEKLGGVVDSALQTQGRVVSCGEAEDC